MCRRNCTTTAARWQQVWTHISTTRAMVLCDDGADSNAKGHYPHARSDSGIAQMARSDGATAAVHEGGAMVQFRGVPRRLHGDGRWTHLVAQRGAECDEGGA